MLNFTLRYCEDGKKDENNKMSLFFVPGIVINELMLSAISILP
jgi:hypothetical protein